MKIKLGKIFTFGKTEKGYMGCLYKILVILEILAIRKFQNFKMKFLKI